MDYVMFIGVQNIENIFLHEIENSSAPTRALTLVILSRVGVYA